MGPHSRLTPNPALKLQFSNETQKTTKTMTGIRDPHSMICSVAFPRYPSEFQLS